MNQQPQFAIDLLVMMFLTVIAFIRPDSPIVAALTTIVLPIMMVACSHHVKLVASWVLFLAQWCYAVGCFCFACLLFLLFGMVAVLVPLLIWQEFKSMQCLAEARFAAYVLRRNANPGRRRHARLQLQAPRDAVDKEIRLIKLLDSSCANLWEAIETQKPRVLKAFDLAPPKADWYPAAELLRICLPRGSRPTTALRTLQEHDRTKNYRFDERLPGPLTCFNHQIDIEVCRLELEVEDLNTIYEHNDRIKKALLSEKENSDKIFKWFTKFLRERGMIVEDIPWKDFNGSDLLPSLSFEPLNLQKKQPRRPLTLKRPKVQWSEFAMPKFTEMVGALFPNESPAQPPSQEAAGTPSQEERGPDTAHTSGPLPGDEDPIPSDDGDSDWVTTDSEDGSDDNDDDDDDDTDDEDDGFPSKFASSSLPPLPPSSPWPPTPAPALFAAETEVVGPSSSAELALPLPPSPVPAALPPSPRLVPLPPSAPSSPGPVAQAAAVVTAEPITPAQSTSANPFLSAPPSLPVWFPAPTAPPATPPAVAVSAPTVTPFVPASSPLPPIPSSPFPPTPLPPVLSSSPATTPQAAAPVTTAQQMQTDDDDDDDDEDVEFEDVPIGQNNQDGNEEDEGVQMDQDTQVADEDNMDMDTRPSNVESATSGGDEEAMLVNSETFAPSASDGAGEPMDNVQEQAQTPHGNNDKSNDGPMDSSAAADACSEISEADLDELNAATFGDDWVPGQSTSAPAQSANVIQGTDDESMNEAGASIHELFGSSPPPTPPSAQGASPAQPTPQRSPFAASGTSSQPAQPAQPAQPSYLAALQTSSLGSTSSTPPPPPASSAVSQTSPVMYFGPVRAQPSSFVAAPQPPVSYGFTASTSAARSSPFAAPQTSSFGFTATAPTARPSPFTAPQAQAFGFTTTAPFVQPSPFAAPQTSSFGFTATAPVTRPSPFAALQTSSLGFTASTSPARPSASAAPQFGFTATAPTTRPFSSATPQASSSSTSASAVASSSTTPSAATAGPSTSSSFTFTGSFSTAANTFETASIFGSAMSQVATRFDMAPPPVSGSGAGVVNNPFVQAPAFSPALQPLVALMEPMRSAVRVAANSWRQQGATRVADELESNWETMFRQVAQNKANANADKKLAATLAEATTVVRHFVHRVGLMQSLQKAPEHVVDAFCDNLRSAINAEDFLPEQQEEEEEAQFAPIPPMPSQAEEEDEDSDSDSDSESEVSEEE